MGRRILVFWPFTQLEKSILYRNEIARGYWVMEAGGASGKVVGLKGRLPGKSYRVAIGRDFSVQEIQARTEHGTAQTRDFIARVVVGCLVLAIGYSAAMGVLRDDWSYLRVVWVPAGPLVGAMTAHYFRKG